MKKTIIYLTLALAFFLSGCHSPPAQPSGNSFAAVEEKEGVLPPLWEIPSSEAEFSVSSFDEIWAYLISGRENTLSPDFPISDIGYFGAELDSYGKLVNLPDPGKIQFYSGRVHLVVACNGRALTHFALAEGSEERKTLVRDLLEAVRPYHGLQIDFEYVPPRDEGAFLSFLAELREGLGGKVFSVALSARTRTIKDDVYDYQKIEPLVDRILVMAYDEHWSTSEPGPIASMEWCERVAEYSLAVIGSEKLVMGIPFYGRSWGDINPNRAFLYSGIERIMREQNINEIARENGIPTFVYETPLSVTVYFEDAYSLSARLAMYKKMGARAVGFWCLGQETPAFWPLINLTSK